MARTTKPMAKSTRPESALEMGRMRRGKYTLVMRRWFSTTTLFVADHDVAPDEKIKELAVGPDFAEAKLEEAARRFDADGAGRERESNVGWRSGGHAICAKTPKRRSWR